MCHFRYLLWHFLLYLCENAYFMKTVFKPRKGKGKAGKIQVIFNYGAKKRFRYSTGLEIENVGNWDYQKNRVKNVIAEPHKVVINSRLNVLQAELEKEFVKLSFTDGIDVNNSHLKVFCDRFFNKSLEEKSDSYELLPFYDWYIRTYTVHPLPSTGKPLAESTIKAYRNSYNLIKRFTSEEYELNYDKIDKKFYYDFLEWLYNQDYATSYVAAQIKNLKTMMEASLELDYHSGRNFKKKYFKKPTAETDNIYLDEQELRVIHEKSLTHYRTIILNNGLKLPGEKLERAKDIFLISSFTGLRVGDAKKLKKQSIFSLNGKKYFQIMTSKTTKPLSIPIHPIVQEILEKRNGELPDKMPDQHINYALKKIGKIAGINEEVEKKSTKGGLYKTETFKKYELICTHTGRRSFCTNAYRAGVVAQDIMTISGHKTERSFMLYLKLGESQKAEKIGEHPFFN